MTTVVNAVKEPGYVEKIFWTTGAYGNALFHRSSSSFMADEYRSPGTLGPGYETICNSSLTNEDESATALLDINKGLCSS